MQIAEWQRDTSILECTSFPLPLAKEGVEWHGEEWMSVEPYARAERPFGDVTADLWRNLF